MSWKMKMGAYSMGMMGAEFSLLHQNLQVIFYYGISETNILAWFHS